ncbi:MAG: outer membrane beta-barrel protein [Dysgonamonadaceae bacterium]|nr:outer membrane beta-barrel protein [Dysgonamonadaceae bacterium]
MKKFGLCAGLAGLFLFGLNSYSQTVSIGARGGLSIPNIVSKGDNPLSKGYESRVTGGGGLFAELGINNHVSFRLGVEYSDQGGQRKDMQALPLKQMTDRMPAGMEEIGTILGQAMPKGLFYADVKSTANFDYLMIPVSVQIGTNANNRWRVYANVGPFVSFLLHGEQITKGQSKMYADEKKLETLWEHITPYVANIPNIPAEMQPVLKGALESETDFGSTEDITSDLHRVNAGIQGDVGLSYRHERHRIFIEIGGNYGFIKMQKDEKNGSNRIGAGSVMLGYALQLK